MLRDCKYPFSLPNLSYAHDALEPYIDKQTMVFHHDKHFNAYISNLNAALEKHPQTHNLTLEEMLKDLSALPADIQKAVRNNGGGVYNHDLYFELMSAEHGQKVPQVIAEAFGGVDEFKKQLKAAAMGTFGSGFAWLVKTAENKLEIISLPNQDTPFANGQEPLLILDVWEHAYYLKYQNLRGDYIDNWFNVVNWAKVESCL